MKHYILVRWRQREGETRRTLVNLHKIVTVVDSVQGCKIHFQGYCLDVGDSFEDVCGMIEAAEAEGSRKPAAPLTGAAAIAGKKGEARHARWQPGTNGWPHCSACGWPADIDREEFRMWGNFRAAERPRCSTCGAIMDGKDTNVPGTNESAPDADPKRKRAFRFGEEEPGESSSIAAPAAMRSIPPSSDDGGGDAL